MRANAGWATSLLVIAFQSAGLIIRSPQRFLISICFVVIEGLFSGVSAEDVLQKLNIVDVEELWDKILCQSAIREEFIENLDSSLSAIERDRVQQVSS